MTPVKLTTRQLQNGVIEKMPGVIVHARHFLCTALADAVFIDRIVNLTRSNITDIYRYQMVYTMEMLAQTFFRKSFFAFIGAIVFLVGTLQFFSNVFL